MGFNIMYFETIEHNNITYSIDMLRLKTYISFSKFSEIEFRFKTVWSQYVKNFYNSSRCSEFFYNYNLEIGEEQSFWFGFLHNNENRQDSDNAVYNFTIEFNPNKIKDNKILLYLLNISGEWFLKSCDMAFDIPVNILNIIFDKGRSRNIKVFSNGYDNKTIYIGSKGSSLFTKIYNKKRENNLNILGNLTRIEVTKKFEDFPIDKLKLLFITDNDFPILYLNNYLYSLDTYKDKTLFAILYAVQNGFDLSMLTRSYRKKIKELFEGGNKILFDKTSSTQILRKVILHYFINNNLFSFK